LLEILRVDELIVLEEDLSIFWDKLVPAGTNVFKFMSIFQSKGFSLLVPGCDENEFGNFRMLDLLRVFY
jgi:hypothetical protein